MLDSLMELSAERFAELDERGALLDVVRLDRLEYERIEHIDFASESNDVWGTTYNIVLDAKAPPLKSRPFVYILFPNHPSKRKRILRMHTYRSIDSLTMHVNARFKESNTDSELYGDARMVMLRDNAIYQFDNLKGNIYVWWASTISAVERRSTCEKGLEQWQPIVATMNGSLRFMNVFWPKSSVGDRADLDMLPLENVRLFHNRHYFPYILESVPEQEKHKGLRIKTMTRNSVLKTVMCVSSNAPDSMLTGRNPFNNNNNNTSDQEDNDSIPLPLLNSNTPYTSFSNLDGGAMSVDHEMEQYPDLGTARHYPPLSKMVSHEADKHIRMQVQLSSVESDDSTATLTPPISRRQRAADLDPFQDSSEEESEEE